MSDRKQRARDRFREEAHALGNHLSLAVAAARGLYNLGHSPTVDLRKESKSSLAAVLGQIELAVQGLEVPLAEVDADLLEELRT